MSESARKETSWYKIFGCRVLESTHQLSSYFSQFKISSGILGTRVMDVEQVCARSIDPSRKEHGNIGARTHRELIASSPNCSITKMVKDLLVNANSLPPPYENKGNCLGWTRQTQSFKMLETHVALRRGNDSVFES